MIHPITTQCGADSTCKVLLTHVSYLLSLGVLTKTEERREGRASGRRDPVANSYE